MAAKPKQRRSSGPRGTQPTYAGEPSATAQVEAWLLKGRRCDADLAARKWSMSRQRYNATIRTLRRRHDIDTDGKAG